MPDKPVIANNTPLVALWVLGRLDLLLLAKEQGLIPRAAPLLTELQNAGLYLAPDLVSAVLRRAGEEEPA